MINNVIVVVSLDGEPVHSLEEELRKSGLEVSNASTLGEAHRQLHGSKCPAVIIRCACANSSLIEFVAKARTESPLLAIFVSAAEGSIEDAVNCMKAGAQDFHAGILDVQKASNLVGSIADDGEKSTPVLPPVPRSPSNSENEPVLVGQSPAICEIRSAINLVAKSQTSALITGESGTGKEIVVQLLHRRSDRSQHPLIALNCASLPRDVIENELFGHEKGAFTGALLKKPGCFELAHGGTLFFDEIAEMSPETQAKLLRAIETQKFRRLGGKEEVTVDVRMIAATNKNITQALKSKELREDLYYRLSVIEIFIPPLRERREDIPLLVEYFLSIFSTKYGKGSQHFTDGCLDLLTKYDWPGNVRELRNIVERALVICPDGYIGHHYLPERIQRQGLSQSHISIPVGSSTHEAERILILQTLASAGNNKAKAAKILGVSRKTLHNKLASFQRK